MSRIGQVAAIILMLALSLIVLGWADSYPVSLARVADSNLEHINPLFWLGLFVAYPAVFVLGLNGSPGVRALCIVIILFLFTAPKLLYLQTGSDTEAFVGLLDYYQKNDTFDRATPYSQWPILTVWGRLLHLFCRCDSAMAFWLFWVILIVGFGLCGYLLFHQQSARNPGDFLGFGLYILMLFWIWDWQVSAYNWSLLLVFLILSLLPRAGWPFRLITIFVFLTLTLSHGLVSFWIPVIMVATMALAWLKTRQRLRISNLLVILVVLQATVLLYHALGLTRRIVLTLQNYYTSLLSRELTVNTVRAHAQGAATPTSGTFDAVTKWLAWLDLALLVALLGGGFVILLWRRRFDFRDWGIFVVGCTHFVIGSFLPLLGVRAVNIMLVLPARGLRELLQERVTRRLTLAVSLLAVVLFPINQLRTQIRNIQYNVPESFNASRYLVGLTESELAPGLQNAIVLADQAQLYYLLGVLPPRTIYAVDPRLEPPTRLEQVQYILSSPQLEIALQLNTWPALDGIVNGTPGGRYRRIYDSGAYVWFGRSLTGDWTAAEMPCGQCSPLTSSSEMAR